MEYIFKSGAARHLEKLPKAIQRRVIKKLDFYSEQKNPLANAEHLTDFRLGEYRFRIGDYRVIFDVVKNKIIILAVGHRGNIYN